MIDTFSSGVGHRGPASVASVLLLLLAPIAACSKSEPAPAEAAPAAPPAKPEAAPVAAAAPAAEPAAAAAAPTANAKGEPKPEGDPSATLRGTGLVAKLFFAPRHPKVGEIFSVCTVLEDEKGAPLEANAVKVDATMPSHGHGMMTEPQHHKGANCWVSEGMKLHMHGPWELSAVATTGATTLTAKANWEQPPEAL